MDQNPWTRRPEETQEAEENSLIELLSGATLSQTERDMLVGKRLSGWRRPVEEDEPRPEPVRGPEGKEKVMRFDGDWVKTPTGVRLVKKNIRYEER